MSDRLGIRAAAELVGCNPVVLYVAAAKKVLPSKADTGVVTFDRADLHRYKVSIVAKKAVEESNRRHAAAKKLTNPRKGS